MLGQNTAVDVKPQTQVESELSQMEGAVNGLEMTVTSLESALGGYLRGSPPPDGKNGPQAISSLVGRAEGLRIARERIEIATVAIVGLMARFEG